MSSTPSPSVSGQPLNNLRPLIAGQASSLSEIPSPSASGQPLYSAGPLSFGQASNLSSIPSPSVSGQPLNSIAPLTSGQLSSASKILSPSVSAGQPTLSTYFLYLASVPLQRSYLLGTPSSSESASLLTRPPPLLLSLRAKAKPMLL